ncbi:MAG: agmatinase [Alphaproteobacteria bacterium]|nr:agmatinase [Alphaproteobacteria bacterium]
MGVPFATDLGTNKAAILGIPFDCGTHPTRIGARYGPHAIREQSALVRPFQPPHADFNPLQTLNVVDCGNVDVTPSVIEQSYERIEAAVSRIVDAACIPVTMGGDGAVTLPQLRAVHRRHPDLVVLHIDAHTDTYPGDGNAVHHRYNTATTFTRAAEEGVVDAANSIHVGPRGTVNIEGVFDHTRRQGYELIDGRELYDRGFAEVLDHIRERLAHRPIYLCFDMDFFDPSCAPGVCTPTWGGATAREGLGFIQGFGGLNFVAFDINTVSPPHDVGGMTAFLAGTVMIECLALACQIGTS